MSAPYLVIDSGNTQAKFGLIKDGVLLRNFAVMNASLLEPEFDLLATLNTKGLNIDAHSLVILASVVPDITQRLQQIFQPNLRIIDHANCGGLRIDMPNPQEVGADRLVNAFAAWRQNGSQQIIIDFGTATTFDVLDDAGCYSGGLILPGVDLSLKTLHQATAKLPKIDISRPKNVLGKTTKQAINQGLYWGYVSMLEGLVSRLEQELGYRCTVTATGGYAKLLMEDCAFITIVDIELTLKGLSLIAEENFIS